MIRKIISNYIDKSTIGQSNSQAREQWVRETLLKIKKGARLLDAGAGECFFKKDCGHLDYVSQDFCQYDGHGDESALQMGQWDTSRIDIVSDITSIPEPDGSFDAILCTEVIEHVPDPYAALREFTRLLKEGGDLIITAPFCSLTHFAPYHFSSGFNRYFYRHYMDLLGFEILEMTENGNFFSYMAQEMRHIRSVAKEYAHTSFGLRDRLAVEHVLRLLQKAERLDTSSQELLNFGFHVHARKRNAASHKIQQEQNAPPVIDVLIPLYHNEKYAVEAIESALNQTLAVRRIIIVDDGSTDRSADIVEQHFAGNNRVTLVRADHRGLPATRNRGLALSDAEFIAILDSDDIWYPHKLEKQMEVFKANPGIGLVYCAYDDIDDEGRALHSTNRLVPHLRGRVHKDVLCGNKISGGSAAIIRRACLEQCGGFDESLTFGEDWDMWLRLAKICSFGYVGEALLAIRRHTSQMTSIKTVSKKLRVIEQHMRIWTKWPEETLIDDCVMSVMLSCIMQPVFESGLSLEKRFLLTRMLHKKTVRCLDPRVYRRIRNGFLLYAGLTIVRVLQRKLGRLRRYLYRHVPYFEKLYILGKTTYPPVYGKREA